MPECSLVRASVGEVFTETQDFQTCVAQPGELSSQQQVVLAALKAEGSAGDAIRLIERKFEADPSCGRCGECSFGAWGTSGNGFKCYQCKC